MCAKRSPRMRVVVGPCRSSSGARRRVAEGRSVGGQPPHTTRDKPDYHVLIRNTGGGWIAPYYIGPSGGGPPLPVGERRGRARTARLSSVFGC
jgi:hypothetical protein